MKTLRLIDWLKLSPMMMAAALLVGCDNAADDAALPTADAPIGAETSSDFGTDDFGTDDFGTGDYAAPEGEVVAPAPVDPVEETAEPATP